MSFLVKFGIRLRYIIIIFFIRRQIYNFVRYTGIFRIGLVDSAVRSLNKPYSLILA